jgi:cytidylate kinase
MENLFLKYMKERTGKKKNSGANFDELGPVISISREFGCPAARIANKLSIALTQKNISQHKNLPWRWISKEIIEESAKELNLSTDLTQDLSDYRTRGFFENVALFFSDEFYPSDVKIKNTIARFIYNAGSEGNVIIVGRAAESITKNFEKSFHIKLQAPIEWRAKQISSEKGISLSDARKEAFEMDKRRNQFRRYFEKERPDIDFFDVFFNCATMTDEEIIEMVIILAESKGFV